MKTSVVSLSGGLDSTSLMIHMLSRGYSVSAISFLYGQKHAIEIEKAQENIIYLKDNGYADHIKHRIINIKDPMSLISSALINKELDIPEGHYNEDSMKDTVIPNRNAIFSSILYGYCLSIAAQDKSKVLLSLGVHAGDHSIYPDCRPEFYTSLYKAFNTGNWNSESIEFYMPYINLNKSDILLDAKKCIDSMGLNFKTIFKNTLTSYQPNSNGISSGRTGSDIERILAFNTIGEIDPIEYTEPWEVVLSNALTIEKNYKSSNK